MAGKKDIGRGGARTGAGRPAGSGKQPTISESEKKAWVAAAEKFAKANGKTVQDAILEMIVDKDVQDSVRVAAAKLYTEALIAKESVKDVTVTQQVGPVIGLPPLKKDPALRVVGE